MRNMTNNTIRNLEMEEHQAIIDVCKILEKGFKKKIYGATINPTKSEPSDVWGIAFSFDLTPR